MNKIGFPKGEKPNEKRRALLPCHVELISKAECLFFESGYGERFGISDDQYRLAGAVVTNISEVYDCEIICSPKAPEESEMARYKKGQIFFGWSHAVQGRKFVDFAIDKLLTVVAWEDMYEDGRHVFWRNNELAGEAAVIHALPFLGVSPSEMSAAVVGFGNCGRGAYRALIGLGANVEIYGRRDAERLSKNLGNYDVLVNSVLWDVFRKDHLISLRDLSLMRRPSMIIDVSCDSNMGVESSRATSLDDPIYLVDGVIHYAVDHTPTIFHVSATRSIGEALWPYIDGMISGGHGPCLEAATCINRGEVLDERILKFQSR